GGGEGEGFFNFLPKSGVDFLLHVEEFRRVAPGELGEDLFCVDGGQGVVLLGVKFDWDGAGRKVLKGKAELHAILVSSAIFALEKAEGGDPGAGVVVQIVSLEF